MKLPEATQKLGKGTLHSGALNFDPSDAHRSVYTEKAK
jgi:hypothetical protein